MCMVLLFHRSVAINIITIAITPSVIDLRRVPGFWTMGEGSCYRRTSSDLATVCLVHALEQRRRVRQRMNSLVMK